MSGDILFSSPSLLRAKKLKKPYRLPCPLFPENKPKTKIMKTFLWIACLHLLASGLAFSQPGKQVAGQEAVGLRQGASAKNIEKLLDFNLSMPAGFPSEHLSAKDDPQPMLPPFACYFNDSSDMRHWFSFGINGEDGWFWRLGRAEIGYDSRGLDDYFAIRRPLHLEKGPAYVAFDYNAHSSKLPEALGLLYGTSTEPGSMTLVCDMDSITKRPTGTNYWRVDSIYIPQAGDYYFAFHAHSKPNKMGLYIDNVEIGQGSYSGLPDLEVKSVLLPVSSCDLSDTVHVQVAVLNKGTDDIEQFRLDCYSNGIPVASQTFGSLPCRKDTVVRFDAPADFSIAGSVYAVKVRGTVLEPGEADTANNTAVGRVEHFFPLPAPFITHFADSNESARWLHPGNWEWTSAGITGTSAHPLVSRCIHLEKGKNYRYEMTYSAGFIFWGLQLLEDFSILYGLSGTDMSTWDTIWKETEAYTETVRQEKSFTCQQEGDYAFAIVSSGFIWIKEITVAEITDFDLCMRSCHWDLARMMPVEQVEKLAVKAVTSIQNMGQETVEAKVEVLRNGIVIGSASLPALPPSQNETNVDVAFTLQGLIPGKEEELLFRVSAAGHESEDLTCNNEAALHILPSLDEMAYDNVTDTLFSNPEEYAVGSGGETSIGLPFYVPRQDTLTEIVLGLGHPQGEEVGLLIHEWDPASNTLGKILYENSFRAGTQSGFIHYPIESIILDAGHYMVSKRSQGYIMMTDGAEEGCLYITSSNPPLQQIGFGYPAIRLVFGQGAETKTKDASAVTFLLPPEEGLFAANEEIAVKVANLGSGKADVPVCLQVDGETVGSKTVPMDKYSSAEVKFEADLSKPGKHDLCAFTRLEGDEDPLNDTIYLTALSMEAADPYVMDFEYCQDFATNAFNPAWISVDNDGKPIGGWQGVSFPLMHKPCGFIAFNPDKTTPSLLENGGETAAPHGGERYGASLYLIDGSANDDWLISPKLALPRKGAKMEFYVKSLTEAYGKEEYNVLVSASSDQLQDFTRIGATREAPGQWEKVEIDLSEFAGKAVHLAIQCVSRDNFMFMIDDITVSAPEGSNQGADRADAQLILYPNPAAGKICIHSSDARIRQVTFLNLEGAIVYQSAPDLNQTDFIYQVNGLPAGFYLARVRTEQGCAVLKFVVR